MGLVPHHPKRGAGAHAIGAWTAALALSGCSLVISGKLDELPERPKDAGVRDMAVPPGDAGLDAGPADAGGMDARPDAADDDGGEQDARPPDDGGDVDACTEALPDPLDGVDDDCNGTADDDALSPAIDTGFAARGRPSVAQLVHGWIVAYEKPAGAIDAVRFEAGAVAVAAPVALTTATDTGSPALATSDDLPVLAFLQNGTGQWGAFLWDDTSVGFAVDPIYPLTEVGHVAVAADPMRAVLAAAGTAAGSAAVGVGGTVDGERGGTTPAGAAITGLAAALSGERVAALATLGGAPGLRLFHRRLADATYATLDLDPGPAASAREPSYAVARGEGHLVFTGDVAARARLMVLDVRPDGTGAGAAEALELGGADPADQPSVAILPGGEQVIAYRRAGVVELVVRASGEIVSGPHRVSPAGARDDSFPVVATSRVTGSDPECRGLVAFVDGSGMLSLAAFSCR